jgi:uncharacterized protein (DUF169 family)
MTTTSQRVQQLLGLVKPPIAIGFPDEAPASVPQWTGSRQPAGCAFWMFAQQGKAFYTVQADHHNCAIGSYTHNIPLPAERAKELEETIGTMVSANYLAMAEVPGIPTLKHSPNFVAYGPADSDSFPADVIVVACSPAQAMLLYEAAIKAGVSSSLASTLGRPACAVLPLAINGGNAALSLGCKGNRTFTGLPDGELYVCVPAAQWEAVAAKLNEAVEANHTMGNYYQNKQDQFASQ